MSTSWLLWDVLFGAIGLGVFVYGKKQMAVVPLGCGLALMVFPYFVTEAMWMLTIAGALIVGLWFAVRRGL